MEEYKGLGAERGKRKEEEEEEEGKEEVCVTPLSITGNYCVFTSAKSTRKDANPHRYEWCLGRPEGRWHLVFFGRIFLLTCSHVFSFLPGTATLSSYPFRA
jgi:hypothetical protein